MQFAYYPGCSLKATGRVYNDSTIAIVKPFDLELIELDDWNCCGATSYMSVRELLSVSISARNLSLAQRQGMDIVAPCSACFTVLRKTDHYLAEIPDLRKKVAGVLAAADLSYDPGSVRVRHLLDVFTRDGFLERLRALVKRPLHELRVAPYYGCQVVRPRVDFDDPEFPTSMDRLLGVIGAKVVYYPVKSRCCGGSLMASNPRAALRLCKNLLLCAQQAKADCIATSCPLCQINLDAFQEQVNTAYGTDFHIPVLYFTQLIGLAMDLPAPTLGFGREIVSARRLTERLGEAVRALPPRQVAE
jgi:heterodisulfide reductase subunit B